MTRRVVSEDGVSLAVTESGSGDVTVVCVHGYPDNGSLWQPVVDALSDRYRVVVYDVRGAGESDKPAAQSAYHLDRLAADLAAVVDAVSPDRPVHLLAHDWGAIQTWHAVTGEWLRGRVASFTSISGPCLDHAGAWLRSRLRPSGLRELLRQVLHSWYIAFFQLPRIPELAWRSGVAGRALQRLDGSGAPPDTGDAIRGLALYRENMLTRFTRPARREADVPVQVLAPQADGFVTPLVQTDISRWVPELWTRRVAGGHWLPRNRPDVVARCTSELIDHIEGAPAVPSLRRAKVTSEERGRFARQVAVITGAGNGIGAATAIALAEEGADLVLTDVDELAVNRTAEQARRHGARAQAVACDVSDASAMADLAKQVAAEYGAPDIVVNNAGIGMAGPFTQTTLADWERVIDVNLWGVIHGCKLFAEQMIARGEGGHIVNLASAAAYLPSKLLPAYATTKSAVLMLSECLRAELTADGIGVTAVCPGFVHTNITATTRFVGVDEGEQLRRQRVTTAAYQRRNYPPEKVAARILRAIERDTPVAPAAAEAHIGLALSRMTPAAVRAAARLDLTPGEAG
ncbi:SDR family oxidoreductase [Haloechinothrix halophila]|uniref:SDR family oxidoreductase n=1 Tax=Haloechinothrix halophila TaxID=1069073 RepID=UPI001E53A34A|nr:SDR family oxidoreductase [Haloechinothrix halophila]